MRKASIWLLVMALLIGLAPTTALAAHDPGAVKGEKGRKRKPDNVLPNPLAEKQQKLRERALDKKLRGEARGKVVKLARAQYVEMAREDTDRVFVVLAEFGNNVHPTYEGDPGPLHNQIAKPAKNDNTTIWQPDYSSDHYRDLYFSSAPNALSMVNYYEEQSSGRYSIEGDVVEWVKVPYNGARYGTNDCDADGDDDGDLEENDPDSNVCAQTWYLIRDAINVWTRQQLASGKTAAQVKAYLDTFDVWDRYDHDGDGDFDEKDGYIDHFQIVHAGEGEETGGGAQGRDAIWSHRWYAYYTGIGSTGPGFNKFGGTQFGEAGVWVGDYTIQPENGGLGVFAHEYGHDLGLPDEYDTSYTGESPSAFWTLMASGSYLNRGRKDALGTKPGHMNAWDKLQLGWLDYDVARAGQRSDHILGPAEYNSQYDQALITILPDKPVTTRLADPVEGEYAWWSGSGNNLDHTLTRPLDLSAVPAGTATTLNAQFWYDIEQDWDYAYVRVSDDGGETWTNLGSTITTNTNPNGQNFGNGITGASDGWVPAAFDLTPYAGESILLGFRYWTDGAIANKGFEIDAITVTAGGAVVFADGAESGANGWTATGFTRTTGSFTQLFSNYYIAELRQYEGFDEALRTGPYNFSSIARPNYAERFPYEEGLLISYWDTSYEDNNVGQHPGEGLILPIDSHPRPMIRPDGQPWRTRVQVYDAPFGTKRTSPISLTYADFVNEVQYRRTTYRSQSGVRTFNDLWTYWYPEKPDAGVKVPRTGTIIEVVREQRNVMAVEVRPAR